VWKELYISLVEGEGICYAFDGGMMVAISYLMLWIVHMRKEEEEEASFCYD